MKRGWILSLLLCLACNHNRKPVQSAGQPPIAARASTCSGVAQGKALPPLSSASAAAIVSDHGSTLEAYQREGGVWLERAPVLVNRDFDFALAMSLEGGVGAGLAAAKRREGNSEVALALRDRQLAPALVGELDALRGCGQHVYFLLWGGQEEAALRLVAEVVDKREQPAVVIEGGRHSVAEWATTQLLNEEAGALLERLVSPHEGT